MDILTSKGDRCRICWEEKVELSWDDLLSDNSNLTYKDCYYKYTQLEYLDDNFSNKLCRNCSNGIEYIDAFISRAIETHAKLQEIYFLNITNENKVHRRSSNFETISTEEIEIKQEIDCSIINEDYSKDFLISPSESKYVCQSEKCTTLLQTRTEQEDGYVTTAGETDKIDHNNQFISKSQLVDKKYSISNRKSEAKEKNYNNYLKEESESDHITEKITSDTLNVTSLVRQLWKYYAELPKPSSTKKRAKSRKKIKKSYRAPQPLFAADKKEENICENFESNKALESNLATQTDVNSLPIIDNPNADQSNAENKSNSLVHKQVYLCQYCSLEFKGLDSIKRHEATHNKLRQRTETCPKCGVKFYDKPGLQVHMNTHDANRQKKFKCEFCDKAFFNRGTLNVHRRIHLGLMVKCQICSKEYYRKIELYKHMNSHSSTLISVEAKKSPRYLVRCKYCSKEILSTSFKSHTAAHLNQPLMKCAICSKEFFRRGSCREHLKTIHKKTPQELSEFIITYEKNRLLHLYLRQKTDLQLNEN